MDFCTLQSLVKKPEKFLMNTPVWVFIHYMEKVEHWNTENNALLLLCFLDMPRERERVSFVPTGGAT